MTGAARPALHPNGIANALIRRGDLRLSDSFNLP
jgi:hypothetical protein